MDKKRLIFAMFIFVLILCTNIFYLNRDFWFDEAFTANYINKPVSYIVQPHDVHPFGFYLILKAIKTFFFGGYDSIYILRIQAAFFGLLSLFCLYYIIKLLFPESRKNCVMTFFYIFSVFYIYASTNIHYFSETRMYAMGIFFALASFLALLDIYRNGFNKRSALTFALVTGILIYIHYYTVLFILCEIIFCILFFNRKEFTKMLKYWFLIFAISIPGVIYFFMQRARIIGMWFKQSDWFSMLSTIYYSFFHSNKGVVSNIDTVFGLIFLAVCFFMIAWYLSVIRAKEEKRIVLFLTLMFLLPITIGMVINLFIYPVYHHRFFLFTGWVFILLVARSFYVLLNKYSYEDRKVLFSVVSVIFFLVLTFVLYNFLSYLTTQNYELRNAAEYLIDHEAEFDGMVIMHESPWSMMPMMYYLRNANYQNFMYTEVPEKALRSAGGDVIPKSRIIRDKNEIRKLGEYIYLMHDGSLSFENFNHTLLLDGDGLDVMLETKIS